MHRLVFVLEQTLGHVAHSRNLVRALSKRPDIDATVIPIPYASTSFVDQLPGLRNWSLRASQKARGELLKRLSQGPADAIFIHTQVGSLLSAGIMRRVPTVVSLDATPINFDGEGQAYGHGRQPQPIEYVKRIVNRRVFREAAALVTWADWTTRSLIADYGIAPQLIHTIHPGVDIDLFKPGEPAEADGPLRLLFVGGDFERKGGPELLEALVQLGPGVEADIVTPRLPVGPIGAHSSITEGWSLSRLSSSSCIGAQTSSFFPRAVTASHRQLQRRWRPACR
jgi:glycosyltransferase involved in cell wall biosynthesis